MAMNNAPQPVQPDLLYDLLDNLPAAVLVISLPDFRLLAVNARACARLGMRLSGNLVGQTCVEAIPRFEEEHMAEMWLASAGLDGADTQRTLVATEGDAVGRRWQASAVRGPHGPERLLVYRIEVPADAASRPEQQLATSTRDIAQALISTIDRDRLLELILEQLRGVVAYDSAAIMLRDDQGYYVAATRGFADPEAVLRLRVATAEPLAQEIAAASDAIIVRDAQAEGRLGASAETVRGWMGVPLRAQGETVGLLTIDSFTPNRYTRADASRAQAFAAYAALAVRNAELYHHARERTAQLEQALSDLRVAQQRLVQSERLSAVGELVAGVAHELNNPLTAVLGFASILQQTAPAELRSDIAPIVEGANRARRIVQNLLTFARQREARLEAVDVNQAVYHVLSLYGYLLRGDGVAVEERLTPDLPPTLADMTAVQQVLLNLINNARQAMAGWKGERRITIRTFMLPGGASQPQRLAIEVADSGPGIKPEHLPLVFEPFFTTKPIGEGTGLGLSICYGIVKQYGGEIRVESSVGEGARFTVELPLRPVLEEEPASTPAPPTASTDRRRILVVDDEPTVGALVARLLTDAGYHTEVCADGAAVAGMLEQSDYDLVICDIKMPGFDGARVYEEIRGQAQGFADHILFMSGDTLSPATREFLGTSGAPFIEKPFDVGEFIATVRRLVERPRSAEQRQ
jgi:signal transduction histidine kinase/CheY-like chemotaxis protein